MRRAIQVDLTEVDKKLREVEAQHAIDVLALESADEAIQEDIENLQHGEDAIDVTAYIPKTEKTDFSVDKLTVRELSKIKLSRHRGPIQFGGYPRVCAETCGVRAPDNRFP
jgi:monomeric isocitrate dehydrogenase